VLNIPRLKVTPNFLIVDYGGMLISPVRGRFDTSSDVTSSQGDHGFLFVSCTVSTLLALFLLPKMAERRFRPLGPLVGGVRLEVKSPFDSLTPIWYRSALEFLGYFLPFKSYSTSSIAI
jgi:hypothetical protein